ncbi:MAG: fructose-6-phosphate aldolase [Deltaproteobacteria bacterium]|nr:fructose-6-phosphate aldolase [Deltaproteobacteria bacterium]
MLIFLDTANLEIIRKAKTSGVVDGITTNPTHVSKEIKTTKDFHELIREICEIVDGPVSAEVVSTDAEGMMKEARELAAVHRHVVVKIPTTPEGIRATSQLTREGIRTNLTLIFSPAQAIFVAKAGATFASPFIGRLDGLGQDGMELVRQMRTIYRNYGFATKLLVASIRHPMHVVEAALAGAEAVTMPSEIFHVLFNHPMTDLGLERFLKDWSKLQS